MEWDHFLSCLTFLLLNDLIESVRLRPSLIEERCFKLDLTSFGEARSTVAGAWNVGRA